MNELMVSRARWSLIPLLRPSTEQENDNEGATSKSASPDISLKRHHSVPTPSASTSNGGFRTRIRHMRDKIRRRVAQTGDWPPPGAIFGDRYSVSSGIGAMLAAGRQIPTSATAGGHWSAPPSRKTYPSSKRNFESFPLKKRSGSDAGAKKCTSSKKGGIVCSEMDMNAIIAGFREFEKSIRILHHNSGVGTIVDEDKNDIVPDSKEQKINVATTSSTNIETVDTPTTHNVTDMNVKSVDPPLVSSRKHNQSGKKQVSFDDRPVIEKVAEETVEQKQTSPVQETNIDRDSDKSDDPPSGSPEPAKKEKQSPKEIEFDEFGQTWDVYGAEFDPEILGLAIQRRLDTMMDTDESKTEDNDTPTADEQKCDRVRRMWKNLLCLTRRQNRASVTTPSSAASNVK